LLALLLKQIFRARKGHTGYS